MGGLGVYEGISGEKSKDGPICEPNCEPICEPTCELTPSDSRGEEALSLGEANRGDAEGGGFEPTTERVNPIERLLYVGAVFESSGSPSCAPLAYTKVVCDGFGASFGRVSTSGFDRASEAWKKLGELDGTPQTELGRERCCSVVSVLALVVLGGSSFPPVRIGLRSARFPTVEPFPPLADTKEGE
jgi:hypothetical protein